jgi:YgiT-type zinc finger domain-containing protein
MEVISMPKLKCIFCGKLTTEREVNIEKKYNGRIVAIKNAVINYCTKCNEKFYSNELTDVIKFALENMAERPIILYEDALYEYYKISSKGDIVDQFKSITQKNEENKEDKEESFILDDVFDGAYYKTCVRTIEERISSKDVKEDLVVMIYHHLNTKTLKAVVGKNDGDIHSLRLSNNTALMGFSDGDPFVLRFSRNGTGYNIGCSVDKVDKHNETIYFTVEDLYSYKEKRRSDRIPVSIYAEICKLGEKVQFDGIVRDLSKHGLLICVKEVFEKGTVVEIHLHTSFKIISLIGAVVREEVGKHNNKYGIEIVKVEKDDMFFLKKHIMCL